MLRIIELYNEDFLCCDVCGPDVFAEYVVEWSEGVINSIWLCRQHAVELRACLQVALDGAER